MAKSKTSSEVEHLRGIIKALKKQIRRSEKRKHLYEDLEIREAEALEREEAETQQVKITRGIERCPKCQGDLDLIDGARVKVYICQDCRHRFTKKVA